MYYFYNDKDGHSHVIPTGTGETSERDLWRELSEIIRNGQRLTETRSPVEAGRGDIENKPEPSKTKSTAVNPERNTESRVSKEWIGKYYYDESGRDVIDDIVEVCGYKSAMDFCLGNIMKYAKRMNSKDTPYMNMCKIQRYAERWQEIYQKSIEGEAC